MDPAQTMPPHPTSLTMAEDELRNDFIRVSHTQGPDSKWHFETVLHKSIRIAPITGKVPEPGGPVTSLALFNRPIPACDFEVLGIHVPMEVHPADWLDFWLEQQGMTGILNRRRIPTLFGAVGDVLARWTIEGTSWIGRFFCTKMGPRIFVLCSRCTENDYPALAQSIFLSIMSFRILDTSPGPISENVRWLNAKLPLPWKLALPASWEPLFSPNTEAAATIDANLTRPGVGGAPAQLLAKLSMAVIALGAVGDWREVGEKTLLAVREAGLLCPSEWVAAPATAAGAEAWTLEVSGTLSGSAVAVHGVIHRHAKAWVAAVVIGPTREQSAGLWMQCRRVLDIVTSTIQME